MDVRSLSVTLKHETADVKKAVNIPFDLFIDAFNSESGFVQIWAAIKNTKTFGFDAETTV